MKTTKIVKTHSNIIFTLVLALFVSSCLSRHATMDPEAYTKIHSYLLNHSSEQINYAISIDKKSWKPYTLGSNNSIDIYNADSLFMRMQSESGVWTYKTIYPSIHYLIEFDFNKRYWLIH